MKRTFKAFRNGIGIRIWHRYGNPHGTAIRWFAIKPGLFGVLIKDSGLHVGLWWQLRFELVCIHENQF